MVVQGEGAAVDEPMAAVEVETAGTGPAKEMASSGGEDEDVGDGFLAETFLQPGEGCRKISEDEIGREGVPGWYEIGGENFNLRVGPNYKKTGKKEPSLSSMFRQLSVDWYKCDSIVAPMAPLMDLPVPSVVSPHPDIPSLFVLNLVLPAIPPAIMRPPENGACYQVVFVAEITQECADVVRDMDSAAPAYKLFAAWCKAGCAKGSEYFGRFKMMGTILNWDEIHLPSMMKRYNSKPCVCTNSGLSVRGRLPAPNQNIEYIDMTVNTFRWGLMARQGLHSLKHKAPEMKMHMTMTIEALTDEEMPERCLFSSGMQWMDPFDGVRRLTPKAVEWLRKEAKLKNRM